MQDHRRQPDEADGPRQPGRRHPVGFNRTLYERYFSSLLTRHNQKKAFLRGMRAKFRLLAAKLARLVVQDMGRAYADAAYRDATGAANPGYPDGGNFNENDLAELFRHPKGGVADSKVFDPWHAHWQGPWSSPGYRKPQFHFWDSTRKVGEQHVQPVTISDKTTVTGSNIGSETGASDTSSDWGYNPAINVFSDDLGITGWVSRRRGSNEELPHIGYSTTLRDPQSGKSFPVLIWIAQRHDRRCNRLDQDDKFFLYIEWVRDGKYGILGKEVVVSASGQDLSTNSNRHAGVYTKQ